MENTITITHTNKQTVTCDGYEQVCDISLACSGGVVYDWEEVPMGEWERRE